MSRRNQSRSGKMSWGGALLAGVFSVAAVAASFGQNPLGDQPEGSLGVSQPKDPDRALLIGPIDGMTTAWHTAPTHTGIPLGTNLLVQQTGPPQATVIWTNAVEVATNDLGSLAECPLTELVLCHSLSFGYTN
ncbi:MAG: hypothetical protein IID36_04240, partial [Planctomycetes bacterium]|nr:hypothetical protein [Planctomycetota bacterium]